MIDFKDLLMEVKIWEGYRSKRYLDAGGVPTIGYGFTASCFPGGFVPETISKEEADDMLEEWLRVWCDKVDQYLQEVGYNLEEKAVLLYALTDFAYNCGMGNLKKLTDSGKRSVEQIMEKLPLYCHAGGKELLGLKRRRNWEVDIIRGNILTIGKPVQEEPTYSIKYLQARLNTDHNAGLVVDGKFGPKTLQAVCKALNI